MKVGIVTGTIGGEKITLKQINKVSALKYFSQGKTIFLQSSKYWPFGAWSEAMPFKLDPEIQASEREVYFSCKKNKLPLPVKDGSPVHQFNEIVDCFIYYNCNNETGKYPNFYISEDNTLNVLTLHTIDQCVEYLTLYGCTWTRKKEKILIEQRTFQYKDLKVNYEPIISY